MHGQGIGSPIFIIASDKPFMSIDEFVFVSASFDGLWRHSGRAHRRPLGDTRNTVSGNYSFLTLEV
jgi:hypothetical protein